ncbi:minichromosome maintenance protein MCM [Halorubrum halodurans]|uniref:DNA helicase n=1 Tax=Halorubrum halodurans TaxID=1383851 RepID=A0A256IR50_9EURY|nr:minichromosome maintenance protein MCM [Halorubrum halodurans]OYR58622.1 AAA family ATPase [Halorubrum halodurans]
MSNQDLTERFIQFYRNYYREEIGELAQRYPNDQRSLYVDYDDLFHFDHDLAQDFQNKPDQIREYAEEALRLYDLPADVSLGRAHVRVKGLPENVEIGEIRVHDDLVGSLISFCGVVRKATDVRPRITEAAFTCQRCGTMTYIPQSGGDYQDPHECQGCERQGPFKLNTDQSEMIDSQELRIQATPSGAGTGETPQSIDVDLVDDVCGQVTPGDHVTVVGILRAEQLEDGSRKTPLFDLYVDGISITHTDELATELTDEDRREITEVGNKEDVYRMFVDSIAPSIRGLETEKLAVLLQLFSGVPKEIDGGESIRGQLHVLFTGDPAVGISRILRSAANLSPRSTYSNGAETSKAGLTAAAARTGGTDGPWELKAGALPIADRGLAAIDNLSKADGDVMGALPEPMEQQQITISKASIHESIDTRVGILAGAAPKDGRFDRYEPLGKQLPIDSQLLSLFDLVFTVMDTPQPEADTEIAEHILGVNRAGEQRQAGEDPEPPESAGAPLDSEFIRKYIAYAREIQPVLTPEAEEYITEFYVDLRSKGADEDAPVPVSARKLEAIVRLSEASARIRLSDTVKLADAERAVDLVEASIKDIGVDPDTGQFDAEVTETGSAETQRERIKNVKGLIADIEKEYEKGAPIDEVLDRSGVVGMNPAKVESEIEKLRTKGEVYEQAKGYLRTT